MGGDISRYLWTWYDYERPAIGASCNVDDGAVTTGYSEHKDRPALIEAAHARSAGREPPYVMMRSPLEISVSNSTFQLRRSR